MIIASYLRDCYAFQQGGMIILSRAHAIVMMISLFLTVVQVVDLNIVAREGYDNAARIAGKQLRPLFRDTVLGYPVADPQFS